MKDSGGDCAEAKEDSESGGRLRLRLRLVGVAVDLASGDGRDAEKSRREGAGIWNLRVYYGLPVIPLVFCFLSNLIDCV